jgi:hypothetical protein
MCIQPNDKPKTSCLIRKRQAAHRHQACSPHDEGRAERVRGRAQNQFTTAYHSIPPSLPTPVAELFFCNLSERSQDWTKKLGGKGRPLTETDATPGLYARSKTSTGSPSTEKRTALSGV